MKAGERVSEENSNILVQLLGPYKGWVGKAASHWDCPLSLRLSAMLFYSSVAFPSHRLAKKSVPQMLYFLPCSIYFLIVMISMTPWVRAW